MPKVSGANNLDFIAKPGDGRFVFITSVHRSSYFLQRDMKVNAHQYATHTEILRKLAQRYLDLDKSYAEQCEEDWKRLTREACRQLPSLTKYQDFWPVKAYVKRYLGNRQPSLRKYPKDESASPIRNRLRRSARASNLNRFQTEPRDTPSVPQDIGDRYRLLPSSQPMRRAARSRVRSESLEYYDLDARPDSIATPERYDNDESSENTSSLYRETSSEAGQPENERSDHDSVNGNERDLVSQCRTIMSTVSSDRGLPRQSSLDCARPALAGASAGIARHCSNTDMNNHVQPSPTRTLSPRPAPMSETGSRRNAHNMDTPPTARDSSAFIRQFLQSLEPNLGHLLPNFLKIGIDNEANLKALLQWHPEDREKWFNDRHLELDMTRFQMFGLLIGCNRYTASLS